MNYYDKILRANITDDFVLFWNGPFSQWHQSSFIVDGITYNCAEQWMMAEKARLFGDSETLNMILSAIDPADQKQYGRQVRGFNAEIWNKNARDIVYKGSYAKYTQNKNLLKILLDTAPRTLVEASPEDRIWGIGLDKEDPRAWKQETWRGTNWLGETLTRVRNDLIAEIQKELKIERNRI